MGLVGDGAFAQATNQSQSWKASGGQRTVFRESRTPLRSISVVQDPKPRDDERALMKPGILPANLDDPRFTHDPASDRPTEWTACNASLRT